MSLPRSARKFAEGLEEGEGVPLPLDAVHDRLMGLDDRFWFAAGAGGVHDKQWVAFILATFKSVHLNEIKHTQIE